MERRYIYGFTDGQKTVQVRLLTQAEADALNARTIGLRWKKVPNDSLYKIQAEGVDPSEPLFK